MRILIINPNTDPDFTQLIEKGASAVAAAGTGDAELAREQLVLARFYAGQILPQCAGLLGAATAGSGDLFALDAAALAGTARKVRRWPNHWLP